MIATIDENEIERLLETTEKLLEICKKNNSLSKYDLESIEDQTYYFRKAFIIMAKENMEKLKRVIFHILAICLAKTTLMTMTIDDLKRFG